MSTLHPTDGPASEAEAALAVDTAVSGPMPTREPGLAPGFPSGPEFLSGPEFTSGPDRRTHSRVSAHPLQVHLRLRGRLSGIRVQALDFNRHGIAIHAAQPLAREKIVFLSLRFGTETPMIVDNLVGVVHNCVRDGDRYRCGIRFRTTSGRQLDRPLVEQLLIEVERALATAGQSARRNLSDRKLTGP